MSEIDYTPRERLALTLLAAIGLLGTNGAFVLALVLRPHALSDALANPIALAFVVEAFVMVAALAYLLPRWGVTRRSWVAFVLLSLLGGLAFALPVALLWRPRRESGTRGG